MRRALLLLPLVLFVGLMAFLYQGLWHDPSNIPSPLIGRPAPTFSLPTLADPSQRFSPAQLRGRVWVLSVFASWCDSCRDEHPVLVEWARERRVPLIGLDYKDDSVDARNWLARLGDPYDQVAIDADGRVGIDFGVYGVPETYVIDAAGVIRHKHTGPLTQQALQDEILPIVAKLSSS